VRVRTCVCVCVCVRARSSLFQSITVSGFTKALSPDKVLYTKLCVFLKWSIQLSETRIDEQLHVEPFPSDGVHQWK